MARLVVALVLTTAVCGCGADPAKPATEGQFPAMGPIAGPDGRGSFRFGAASAATQIEDRNPDTDWYLFTQPTADGGLGHDTFVGDAAMGYSKAIEDIDLVTSLHLDSYRFSMEWARVEPQRDVIDEAALTHYGDLLDGLVAANVRPNVTLHHFSNPVWVADPRDTACTNGPTDANLCGLGHPQGGPLVIAEMAEHARLLAERFGDRVDDWATMNEPVNYLLAAYGIGAFPPGIATLGAPGPGGTPDLSVFLGIVRNYLAAHAAMYDAIKLADTIDADGDGVAASVGMTLATIHWVPARSNVVSTDAEDVAARDRLEYVFHYIAPDSILNGAFDQNLDGTADEQHPEWAGRLDWLGLQYYLRSGVTALNGVIPLLGLTPCFNGIDGGACVPALDATHCVPAMGYEFDAAGFYDVMMGFSDRYPDLPLTVTEAGIATEVGARRAENVVRMLEQIDRARTRGADVRGYYHWSLFDNFEWNLGFQPRFGLYNVDYSTYARAPTTGADVLGEIAGARGMTREQLDQYGGNGPMTPEGTPPTDGICRLAP